MKRSLVLAAGALALLFFIHRYTTTPNNEPVVVSQSERPVPSQLPLIRSNDDKKPTYTSQKRLLELPVFEPVAPIATPPPPKPLPLSSNDTTQRAEGRKTRSSLPMGVVLWDKTPVYSTFNGNKKRFEMGTADLVRVFPDEDNNRYLIQPGLDIYLAATTRKIEAAGMNLPDEAGWVEKTSLKIFNNEEAHEFLMDVEPVTLGNDDSFSTLSFYERAMKNSDPVIHRVIGPRLIALVNLHEEYDVSSWGKLYRDYDPRVRDAALSTLRKRGVGNSRLMIDDLLKRLSELTKFTAKNETELEALTVLRILHTSENPHIPIALQSFVESWDANQSDKLNKALNEAIDHPTGFK